MIVTKETLKSQIDKVPETYFNILYRIIQTFITPFELITAPFNEFSEDVLTPKQLVAKIQNLPKNSANIERATESLAEGLLTSPHQRDSSFDVDKWNRQWDEIEAKMKRDELFHEETEQHI
ncbi:hypothetical protein QUF64_09200 [Anaerolineales bacterium HSG6]|nr:hypothetical protein [Anaerolineales bacterium HSG6]